MIKEHKKLYKSGKNWVVATLAVASLGVVAGQQTASADSTNAAATQTANLNNQVQNAQKAVNQAQADAKTADDAYNAQQTKVNASQQNLNEKQAAVKQAQDNVNKDEDIAKQATPENIKKAQDDITSQKDSIKTAQQNVDNVNGDVTKAQSNLTTAQQKQTAAQNVVNDKKAAKQSADDKVAKAEADVKNSGLDEAQQNVNKVQQTLDDIKKTNENNEGVLKQNQDALADTNQKIANVKKNIETAKKAVTDAQNNVNTKQQALNDAQKALTDLQNKVAQDEASGAAGFFKSISDNTKNSEALRQDAERAYKIVTGQPNAYQNTTVKWYKDAVKLGQKGDSTSLANLEKAMGYYQEWMEYRDKYGLQHPSISLTAVAIAMLSSDFQGYTNKFDHPANMENEYGPFYGTEEDINAGSTHFDPVDEWMGEKSLIDDYIKEHPEAAQYSFEKSNPLTQEEWEEDEDFWYSKGVNGIGHYKSMIKPDANYVGLATNDYVVENHYDGATSMDELWSEIIPDSGMTFDSYQNLVHSYLQNVKQEDQIKALKANIETAQKNLTTAKGAIKPAQDNVAKLQANLTELNNGVDKINKAIANTQAALKKGKDDLSYEQGQLENANKNLADIKAKVGVKAQNLEKAKQLQSAAAKALDDAQVELNNADSAVKSAQQAVNDAQNNVNAKKSDLKSAQDKLTSLEQYLDNLKNAKSNLAKAQDDLKAVLADNDKAAEDVQAQQASLDKLKKAKDAADSNLVKANTALQAAQREYDAANQRAHSVKVNNPQKATVWSATQTQELANFVNQYGKDHNMKFIQFDGKNSLNSAPLNDGGYPDFSRMTINSFTEKNGTIGMSLDGSNKYDYNVVAIFNHNGGNYDEMGEWHNTYFFAFHNGKPVVLQDWSTEDHPALYDLNSRKTVDLATWKAFQAEFDKLAATSSDNEVNQSENEDVANSQVIQNSEHTVATTQTPGNAVMQASHSEQTPVTNNTNAKTNANQLPQTGNQNSVAALLLGAASAMFGFGLMKKKEY